MRQIDADKLDILGFLEEVPIGPEEGSWNAAVRSINTYVSNAPTIHPDSHYKSLYIEALKEYCPDACEFCAHNHVCEGEKCDCFCQGDTAEMDGKTVKFKWTCEDLNWGDCPKLDKTPCFECIKNNYSGFELKEEKHHESN